MKVDTAHPLSLLVTDTLYPRVVPAGPCWFPGNARTVGLFRTQLVTTWYVDDADAWYEAAEPLVEVAEAVYEPTAAEVGDVTCIVVEAVAPAARLSVVEPTLAVQPDGALADCVKVDAGHPLSLLVTDAV